MTERLRRPRNLKPCHEIAHGLTGWARVVSVEDHPYMADTVTVHVASEHSDTGTRPVLLHRNRPIRSRLAEKEDA